jgi:L,D-transpeptidase-like protein
MSPRQRLARIEGNSNTRACSTSVRAERIAVTHMLRRHFAFGLVASPLLIAGGRASAKGVGAIKALRPGEFIWRPEISPRGPVVIVVSVPEQLTHVYRNGIAIGVSTCSTGMAGHNTPTGVFTILQKREQHYSSTYNNAPMPNMQRLTWQGTALHAGNLPGYPASHGCIRLPMQFSKLVFSITQLGTSVIIADQKSAQSSVVRPDLVLPKDVAETAQKAQSKARNTKKTPSEDAKTASVSSILVSGADRKAYLVVNGVVSFETPISVVNSEKPLGTHLFSLIGPSPDGHSLKWTTFGLGGHPEDGVAVDIWSDSVLGRIEYRDGAGVRQVARTLHPGTTMVITDFAASPETRTAPDFTVITEDAAPLTGFFGTALHARASQHGHRARQQQLGILEGHEARLAPRREDQHHRADRTEQSRGPAGRAAVD